MSVFFNIGAGLATVAAAAEAKLASIVTSEMMYGVMDEMLAMLPIAMPVAITYIGLRKGIGFVFGILHQA